MTTQNGRAFNEWLRAQLKAKKMSQRQLAQQSGVDHSTISRLIRGDRTPSLATATALARGLRELRDEADMPVYLNAVSSGAANPLARVEYALRSDDYMSEAQVRQVMEYYIAVRTRRFGGGRPGSSDSFGHRTGQDTTRTADLRRAAGAPVGASTGAGPAPSRYTAIRPIGRTGRGDDR
jgi:transcriptional regulator with XRE-family HTH domain